MSPMGSTSSTFSCSPWKGGAPLPASMPTSATWSQTAFICWATCGDAGDNRINRARAGMYGSRPQAPTPTWTPYGQGTESTEEQSSSMHAVPSYIRMNFSMPGTEHSTDNRAVNLKDHTVNRSTLDVYSERNCH
ncbi:hypothetical protein FQN60_001250 [Etheostoma spectabile]|uniref:Uncharacterized protein n=1 Tax=Etheostoma spectabile TaxID=54343 RepID=A0A5J5D5Z9_9PERO|nr:hypothetical protein FQN60_001250 [Etheostoma spectabile]